MTGSAMVEILFTVAFGVGVGWLFSWGVDAFTLYIAFSALIRAHRNDS